MSLVDLMFALGLSITLAGIAVAQTLGSLGDMRAVAAARYVSARLQHTRVDAIVRGRRAALRITRDADGYSLVRYVDGNRNGVLSADIQSGVDRAIDASEKLEHRFGGVTFGAIAGLPPVDPGGPPPGNDPIRTGAGNMVTFTPTGTSSSGSLYILGNNGAQLVVRVFGQTGKTRVLKFDARNGQWRAL